MTGVCAMIYKIDVDRWGRFFTVPCSVVDEHIKLADGDFVKVLLCILAGSSGEADTSILSSVSGVPEDKVCDAVLYWAGCGVIRADGIPAAPAKKAVAVSAEIRKPTPDPVPAVQPAKSSIRYSPKELANKLNESPGLLYIVREFEKIKGCDLRDNEIMGIINLREYYGFDEQSLLLIIEYCHKLGKDNIAYIEKVGKDWFSKDITSYPEVEAEIIRQSKLKTFENKVARAFGLSGKLAKRQIEYIHSWKEMGFSVEMLEIAYDKCMSQKNELKFSYINGILRSWFEKGIFSSEQVEQEDKRFVENMTSKHQREGNKNTSYDLDEWEKFALNFDPTIRGDNNG